MTHPSDDDLLDQVLREGEPDAVSDPHLDACPSCAERYAAVRAEQALLRRSFRHAPEAAATVAFLRPRRQWAAAAAALVLGALLGATADRLLAGSRTPAADLEACVQEVRRIAGRVEILREVPPARVEREFPTLLDQAHRAYGDYLEARIDTVSVLDDDQRSGLRAAVADLFKRAWVEDDRQAGPEFRAALRRVLSANQYVAFEAFLDRDRTEGRAEEIERVTDAVAQTLNLRQSEEDRVKQALVAAYPRADLPLIPLAQWPPDELVGDGTLAGNVRAALPSDYHRAFDGYLERLRAGRGAAARAARSFMAGRQAR
jgi:hypothetical protein